MILAPHRFLAQPISTYPPADSGISTSILLKGVQLDNPRPPGCIRWYFGLLMNLFAMMDACFPGLRASPPSSSGSDGPAGTGARSGTDGLPVVQGNLVDNLSGYCRRWKALGNCCSRSTVERRALPPGYGGIDGPPEPVHYPDSH